MGQRSPYLPGLTWEICITEMFEGWWWSKREEEGESSVDRLSNILLRCQA